MLPAFLLAARDSSDSPALSEVYRYFSDTVDGMEPLIYACAFLPPVFLHFWDLFMEYQQHIREGRRSRDHLRGGPTGAAALLTITAIVFIITTFIYGYSRNDSTDLTSPSNNQFFVLTLSVYGYTMFCWYLTVADSIQPPAFDYALSQQKEVDSMSQEFSERIADD